MDNLLLFAILLSLVILSAFFSSGETAFLSLSKIKLKTMKEQKLKNHNLVEKMLEKKEFFLSTFFSGEHLVGYKIKKACVP